MFLSDIYKQNYIQGFSGLSPSYRKLELSDEWLDGFTGYLEGAYERWSSVGGLL